MGAKLGASLDRPAVPRFSAWIGVFGFIIGMYYLSTYSECPDSPFAGLTSFLIIRMWFGKAVDDFNSSIQAQGKGAPQLIASTSNGFTSMLPRKHNVIFIVNSALVVVWVAYAFQAVPLIASLAKLNVTATKSV